MRSSNLHVRCDVVVSKFFQISKFSGKPIIIQRNEAGRGIPKILFVYLYTLLLL